MLLKNKQTKKSFTPGVVLPAPCSVHSTNSLIPGVGVLPYISHLGMCPLPPPPPPKKRYGFCALLVWKREYILPILVWNRVWFTRELREYTHVFCYFSSKWILRKKAASYPDVSLRCARKGRREGDNGRGLPSVPFPWSLAVHHQSPTFRARLCHAKNEAPEEETGKKE